MKKKIFLAFMILFIFQISLAQEKKGESVRDSIPWYNAPFYKGSRFVVFTPGFSFFYDTSPGGQKIFQLGVQTGYGKFLTKSLAVDVGLTYAYFFQSPMDDANAVSLSVNIFYFFPLRKFFYGYGAFSLSQNYFYYRATGPGYLFYDDPVDYKWHLHSLTLATPDAGLMIRIRPRISFLLGMKYNFYVNPGPGRKHIPDGLEYRAQFIIHL